MSGKRVNELQTKQIGLQVDLRIKEPHEKLYKKGSKSLTVVQTDAGS